MTNNMTLGGESYSPWPMDFVEELTSAIEKKQYAIGIFLDVLWIR